MMTALPLIVLTLFFWVTVYIVFRDLGNRKSSMDFGEDRDPDDCWRWG